MIDIPSQKRLRSVRVYARVTELLGDCPDKISSEDAKRILADHEGKICRGEHDPAKVSGDSWGTLYALIARPHSKRLEISPGHPCRARYVQASFRKCEAGS